MKFVMCVKNEGYERDLTLFKVYRILPDAMGEKAGMIRVVDETGEDYLYSPKWFVPVELPPEGQEAFEKVAA